ncbi:uncharacterized protein EI90DRAFT_3010871 [Cantharellus anzutake]|uniref:uncharacterized protein n=1 Tax=Cantharellus anzutake TaxID=1750568 RepID=UPI0019030507|nr:uncharacterized protein EI90DRAFT_3010871 [Cantharellus anzutake]KAF8344054.1 hypothetical protein EI90DRAFT_3010871 [Cantharellus anzutake]
MIQSDENPNQGAYPPFIFPFSSSSLFNTFLSAPDGVPLLVIRTSDAESSSATIVAHTKNPHVRESGAIAGNVVASLRWDKWDESVMWVGGRCVKFDGVVGSLVEERSEKCRTYIVPTPVGEWRWWHSSQLEPPRNLARDRIGTMSGAKYCQTLT